MVGTEIILLTAGLAVLWWAGDRSVRYAIELTELVGVSSFTVGFIVMSVSTGLPEIMTAIISSMSHAAELSAGDLVGSSLVNLTLILGISAVAAGQLTISKKEEHTLLKILFITSMLVAGGLLTTTLNTFEGIILLLVYLGSVLILQREGLMQKIVQEEEKEATEELEEEALLTGVSGTILKLAGSMIFVIIGARITVNAAITIAGSIGLPLETMGATLVAIGTGLPELSLELNSVKRKEYALAMGDIFGSTLVNLTLILGILSIASPVTVTLVPLLGTIAYLILTIGFLWVVMLQNHGIEREHGYALVIIFLFYLIEEYGVAQVLYHIV